MNDPEKLSVLFVCMGNICRSPTAEGVFRKVVADAGLADRFHVDSAGTHAYHVNEPPDRRSQAAAERRGFSLADIRARRFDTTDFENFDYIFAMDRDNLRLITDAADGLQEVSQVYLFLDYATGGQSSEVPDPYYGGASGFERVLDLVEDASKLLLEKLRSQLR